MPKIILISSNNKEKKVVAQNPILIKNMVENIGNLDDPIPLSNVTYNVLENLQIGVNII